MRLKACSEVSTYCSPYSECSNFNLDLSGGDAGTIMVNPNSVMPHSSVIRSLTPNNNNPTLGSATMMTTTTTTTTTGKGPTKTKTKMTRRHFSFSSCNKNETVKEERIEIEEDPETCNEEDNDQYENDITETEEDEEEDSEEEQQEEEEEEEVEEEEEIIENGTKFIDSIKTKQQQLNITVNSLKSHVAQITNGKIIQSPQKINNPLAQIRVRNFKILQATSPNLVTSPQSNNHVRKQIYNNNVHHHHLHHHHHHVNAASTTTGLASVTMAATTATTTTTTGAAIKRDIDITEFDEKPYPKPAYSYSCLIAMALKNSQTGSLPVSEIYNFMCEHFPYFKTAPNGWKNSVRHNLSLNKCFEKIEKPAGNGNQRKGCLWAINPAKIAKMDEEVSKWSRKDPLAIKKAMIYPDHLELLERGEMKYAGTGSDISEETESSGDEATEAMSPTYGEELALGHVAANSVTDSYDESSQDCDVDVAEHHLYDEIDIEEDNKEAFHMQLNITKQQEDEQPPFAYELSPSAKRQKTLTGTLQGNYVYQTVTTSRRKTPLLVRAATNTGTFLKIE